MFIKNLSLLLLVVSAQIHADIQMETSKRATLGSWDLEFKNQSTLPIVIWIDQVDISEKIRIEHEDVVRVRGLKKDEHVKIFIHVLEQADEEDVDQPSIILDRGNYRLNSLPACLTYEKKGDIFILRPQKGIFGFSSSGIPLHKNIAKKDIIKFD